MIKEEQITSEDVKNASKIIETVDTIRHQRILGHWLETKKPFLLCGPPGSGKTMTLMSTLKDKSDLQLVFINFSASTTPETILKKLE